MNELNEFEADDRSLDSTYPPMIDGPHDSFDEDDTDSFNPKNVYENYPNKTAATVFCSSNVQD